MDANAAGLTAPATANDDWNVSCRPCSGEANLNRPQENDLSGEKSEGDTNISALRAAWQAESLDAETRELLADDARYFLHQSLSTPCLNALRSCGGIWLEDVAGRRYMDFHGNNVHQVGFANPEVIEAIKSQLDELPFCTRRYTNRVAVDLAHKLGEITPGDFGKVLLCPGGTSAIGMALKLARIATGRHKFISMWDAFHGASLDAISVGGEAVFRAGVGPLLPGCEHVPPADAYRCLWDCSARGGCDLKCEAYLEYVLEHERDVAAVIAEPVRSTPYIPPPEYWQAVRRACDRHGTLLIFDEICHGLGRTGPDVHLRAFWRHARHSGHRQGTGRGRDAAGGDDRPAGARRRRRSGAGALHAREKSRACAAGLGHDPLHRRAQAGRSRPQARRADLGGATRVDRSGIG